MILAFGLVAVALAIAGISFGPVPMDLPEVFRAFLDRAEPRTYAIVVEIRAPRVVLAAAVAAVLALSGAMLQGMLRNPLADTGLISVTAVGALGAVCAIVLGGFGVGSIPEEICPWLLPVAAFVGASGVTTFIFAVSRRGGTTHAATSILA